MFMKNSPHPGDCIRTELVEPASLSITAAAKALRVSRSTQSSLLNGKADLSGEMALRLEKAFGVKMDTLDGPCRILALDGGGAKGFYTLGVLKEIEGILKCPLYKRFDP